MLSPSMDTSAAPPPSEAPLKTAVKLCGRSEKTLRRRIESGELRARQVPLEYGGFLWAVDLNCLLELYPDADPLRQHLLSPPDSTDLEADDGPSTPSAEPALPQDSNAAVHPGQPPLSPLPSTEQEFDSSRERVFEVDPSPSTVGASASPTSPPVHPHADQEDSAAVPPDSSRLSPPTAPTNDTASFFSYLLAENSTLKDELRERDQRIHRLLDRSGEMERELGEQRGTAKTQAQVLEWFYQHYGPPELPPAPGDPVLAPSREVSTAAAPPPSILRWQVALVIAALTALGTWLYWATLHP